MAAVIIHSRSPFASCRSCSACNKRRIASQFSVITFVAIRVLRKPPLFLLLLLPLSGFGCGFCMVAGAAMRMALGVDEPLEMGLTDPSSDS
jgi:hypothetical protein